MIDFERVKAEANGKWPNILQALGIDVGNGKHGPCPACGGEDRFRFEDVDSRDGIAKGAYYCSQCEPGGGINLVMKVLGVEYKEAMETIAKIVGTVEPSTHQAQKTMTPEKMRKIFKSTVPIRKGDPGHLYLVNRGLKSMPKMLRVGQIWEAETHKDQMAIVAVFTLPDGEAATMHRTYIKDGYKLDIKAPKRFLPNLKPLAGGAVRLYDVGPVLGVTEGLETAIACKEQWQIPVWATMGTAMMESFEPPKEVEQLIVFADNDINFAGQKAAFTLANRIVIQRKIPVSVEVPDTPGIDFLDEIRGAK